MRHIEAWVLKDFVYTEAGKMPRRVYRGDKLLLTPEEFERDAPHLVEGIDGYRSAVSDEAGPELRQQEAQAEAARIASAAALEAHQAALAAHRAEIEAARRANAPAELPQKFVCVGEGFRRLAPSMGLVGPGDECTLTAAEADYFRAQLVPLDEHRAAQAAAEAERQTWRSRIEDEITASERQSAEELAANRQRREDERETYMRQAEIRKQQRVSWAAAEVQALNARKASGRKGRPSVAPSGDGAA